MNQRGRPKKYRKVRIDPRISQFSPRGRPGRPDEVSLTMDEFEALRLADFKGLRQQEAARLMGISQQTFSRILKKARSLVAGGLVGGKIIKIKGGYYVIVNPDIKPQKELSTAQNPTTISREKIV